jgi:hypothetical protein
VIAPSGQVKLAVIAFGRQIGRLLEPQFHLRPASVRSGVPKLRGRGFVLPTVAGSCRQNQFVHHRALGFSWSRALKPAMGFKQRENDP